MPTSALNSGSSALDVRPPLNGKQFELGLSRIRTQHSLIDAE